MKIHQLATATDNLLCIKYDAICVEEGGAVDAICLEINGNMIENTLQIKEGETVDRIYLVEIKDKLHQESFKRAMKQIEGTVKKLRGKKGAVAVIIINEKCPKLYLEAMERHREEKMKELKIPIYIKCPEGFPVSEEPETGLKTRVETLEQVMHELM